MATALSDRARVPSGTRGRIPAPWLALAGGLWVAVVTGALALYAAALPEWLDQLRTPAASRPSPASYGLTAEEIAALVDRGITAVFYARAVVAAQTVTVLFAVIAGAVIFWRRRDDWLALIVALWLILIPTNAPVPPAAVLADEHPAWFAPVYGYYALFILCQLLAFTLFPSGRFQPRWWGWVVASWTPVALLLLHPSLTWIDSPPGFAAAIGSHYAIAIGGIVQQYRYAVTADERLQIKWASFAMIGGFTIAIVSIFVRIITEQYGDPFLHALANLAGVTAFFLSLVLLDAGFGISILRYRLWDIDVLVNRSLVYGALTAVLFVLAGGSVLLISRLFEQMTGGQQSAIAAGFSALLFGLMFQPARRRIQRFVDRAVFGIAIEYEKSPAAAAVRHAAIQLGAFSNLQLVGRGGMADIYKGEHPALKCPVAIKVLPAVLAESQERRQHFKRESRALAALQHPNIVRVYEHGEVDGAPFLVMEFIAGRDLGEMMQPRGALPLEEVFPIVDQIAAALDYAHTQGVVHRDVKPSNVMLEDGPSGMPPRVVLMDFGIARILGATTQLTPRNVIGTLTYIAPEQIQTPADVDRRADVYSLGVLVYQMLTGQPPFETQTPLGLLIAHLNQPPPDPCRVRPTLNKATCAAVLRAMEKKPKRRFDSAGEFARALHGDGLNRADVPSA